MPCGSEIEHRVTESIIEAFDAEAILSRKAPCGAPQCEREHPMQTPIVASAGIGCKNRLGIESGSEPPGRTAFAVEFEVIVDLAVITLLFGAAIGS